MALYKETSTGVAYWRLEEWAVKTPYHRSKHPARVVGRLTGWFNRELRDAVTKQPADALEFDIAASDFEGAIDAPAIYARLKLPIPLDAPHIDPETGDIVVQDENPLTGAVDC